MKRFEGRDETIIDPDLPIVDTHHHLLFRPSLRYLYEDYLADEAADYLPHPERGERAKNRNDGYRQLLREHRKFMHAVGRTS